jgi:hypothetical protein
MLYSWWNQIFLGARAAPNARTCVSFLDPFIESWHIDLETFGVEVVLNRRLALERVKRCEFLEKKPERVFEPEPDLKSS